MLYVVCRQMKNQHNMSWQGIGPDSMYIGIDSTSLWKWYSFSWCLNDDGGERSLTHHSEISCRSSVGFGSIQFNFISMVLLRMDIGTNQLYGNSDIIFKIKTYTFVTNEQASDGKENPSETTWGWSLERNQTHKGTQLHLGDTGLC